MFTFPFAFSVLVNLSDTLKPLKLHFIMILTLLFVKITYKKKKRCKTVIHR